MWQLNSKVYYLICNVIHVILKNIFVNNSISLSGNTDRKYSWLPSIPDVQYSVPDAVSEVFNFLCATSPVLFWFQNLAPKWLLYTLASLYWRVRNNNIYALNCLISAKRLIQDTRYRDLVLVSLSSVFLELGFFDEATSAIDEAFKINLYEVRTFLK